MPVAARTSASAENVAARRAWKRGEATDSDSRKARGNGYSYRSDRFRQPVRGDSRPWLKAGALACATPLPSCGRGAVERPANTSHPLVRCDGRSTSVEAGPSPRRRQDFGFPPPVATGGGRSAPRWTDASAVRRTTPIRAASLCSSVRSWYAKGSALALWGIDLRESPAGWTWVDVEEEEPNHMRSGR